jgi:uncharacterized tellurite resistance protein B-like protein
MNLSELSQDEKLALVALIKATVMADGQVSLEEVVELQSVVDDLGEETYHKLLDEVEKRFESEDALRKFLKTIKRQDAQELIYGTVMEIALTDSLQGEETDVLEWLAEAWNLEVDFGAEG